MDIKTLFEIGTGCVSVYVAYTNLQIKADIAKLQVWIYENFEAKKKCN